MKRTILALLLVVTSVACFSQNTYDTVPPFRRSPVVPPFRLLQSDSVTLFTKDQLKKDRPVLVMVFNPECEHCKHEIDEIMKHLDDFKKVQVVMASMGTLAATRDFYSRYKMSEQKNFSVGQDFQYMLPSFYRIHSLPFLAMYDRKENLLSTFEGTMKIEDLINVFK